MTETDRLSDTEAFMWTLEQDPMLSSTFGALSFLDQGVDHEVLRNKMLHACAELPRLRRRISDSSNKLVAPAWEVDRDFEVDYHLRRLALPTGSTQRDLLDLATRLVQDPMDRTRPLWVFYLIEGLADGGTAILTKMHHTITDGEGGVKLAERYMDFDRNVTDPGPIDLQPILDADASADGAAESMGTPDLNDLTGVVTKGLDVFRQLAGDAAVAYADPARVPEKGAQIVNGARQLADQLAPSAGKSTLWADRTRRRRFDLLDVDFDDAKASARRLGGSLNDLLMAATIDAAAAYHHAFDDASEEIVISFIMSTRQKGDDETSNAFTPSKITVPLGDDDAATRFRDLHERLELRKSEARGGGLFSGVAGVANLLPTSVLTRAARAQAAGVDLATSNVRAAPFAVYVGGAKVEATYPIGPVAGTAANITMMSYDGQLHIGVHSDPEAIADPDLFIEMLGAAFDDLIGAE